MQRRIPNTRRKLSPVQLLKGYIIRVGLAKKVRIRDGKPRINRDGRESNIRFQFIWHRVALLLLALMALGWVSLATGAYFFVKYARDFPEVRFVDLVFPPRWDEYRTARGDYYIEKARNMLDAGETLGVIHLVRVGVQQSPDNTEGRLLLAQIYNSLGRPDLGIEVLRGRIASHSDDIEYLEALISLLFVNHQDRAVEELATKLLDGDTEPTDRNLMLALAAATANFNRGNYDRAEELIGQFNLLESRPGTLLQARIDWERGATDDAIAALEKILTNPGPLEAEATNYLIEYLWSSGHEAKAERVAFVRFMADPLSYAPRIRLLHIYNKRGENAREATEIGNYLELFGEEEEAMQALARFAAQTGQPDLARTIYDRAREQEHLLAWPALCLIEARINVGAHSAAVAFFEEIEASVADWTPLEQARLQPLLAAAYLGAGNAEKGAPIFTTLLTDGAVSANDLALLSERLIEIGDFARARRALSYIHQHQPLNQTALTSLISLDLDQGNTGEVMPNLQELLKMRKPSKELLQEAHRHISSDKFIFQAGRQELLDLLETALVTGPTQTS